MNLTRLLSTTVAAFACIAASSTAAAQARSSHSVRVTRSGVPPLGYASLWGGDPFASAFGPWPAWGAGSAWPSWSSAWPTAGAGAWPTAYAGAWPTARAGAVPSPRAGFSSDWADRMFAEMDRDMAEMEREMDAMFASMNWGMPAWSAAPAPAPVAGAGVGQRIEMAPASYPWPASSHGAYPGGYGYPAGYGAYGYPVAGAGATSGYAYSTQSYDDGRCVRTVTTTQTLGGPPQTTTSTNGRC